MGPQKVPEEFQKDSYLGRLKTSGAPITKTKLTMSFEGEKNEKKNLVFFGFFSPPKDMVNFVLVIGAPEVFNLPNNEFFRNLTWTLWVPIGFTTASIEDLLQF